MVAVKRRVAHHLHKGYSIEGEGIKDVLKGVKHYARNLHSKVYKKLGSQDLKDIALRAKKNEEQSFKDYENSSVGRRRPDYINFLKDKHNKIKQKALNQVASYDNQTPESVNNFLKRKKNNPPMDLNNYIPPQPYHKQFY
jgi:hypothetical protein